MGAYHIWYTPNIPNQYLVLEWTFCHRDELLTAENIPSQHRQTIGSVVMEILRREAKTRQLVHGLTVIVVPAIALPEVEIPNRRRVLLDPRQLRHVRGSFLVTHVNRIPVLLSENTIHVVRILLAAVIRLGLSHLHLVGQNLRYHTGLRHALIPAVENPIVNIHVVAIHEAYRHTQRVTAAPCHVIHEYDVIWFTIG